MNQNQNMYEENLNNKSQESMFDFRKLLFSILKSWYLFPITIIISLSIAYVFNKYTQSEYEVSSTIMMNDKGNSDAQMLIGFGIDNNATSMSNEIAIMNSISLKKAVLKENNFWVTYFSDKNLVVKEVYDKSPFIIEFDKNHPQAVNARINITISSEDEFTLESEVEDIVVYDFNTYQPIMVDGSIWKIPTLGLNNKKFKFNELITTDAYSFKVIKNPSIKINLNAPTYYFIINDLSQLYSQFAISSILPVGKESTILELKVKGKNKKKITDFLNAFVDYYIAFGLKNKNLTAERTVDFIENELIGIKDSLDISERQIELFKKDKKTMSIEGDASMTTDLMAELSQERAVVKFNISLYQYLYEYVNSNNNVDDNFIPPTVGIEDQVTLELISELSKLYAERARMGRSTAANNPFQQQNLIKIENTKKGLLTSINNTIKTSKFKLNDIENRIDEVSKEFDKYPTNQRVFKEYERQFMLNNSLYTYLLQRRAEALITKVTNMPDNTIVDSAEDAKLVYPQRSQNYLIALLLGVLLPVGYIFARSFFDDRVQSTSDIESITTVPIVGTILHSDRGTKFVVEKFPKSTVSESFRAMRSNLQFFARTEKKGVTFLITSDVANVGKSFIAINLASIIAKSGKKTLLMGLDLRKPRFATDYNLKTSVGLTSYLIGKASISDIIFETKYANLYVMPQGVTPPNPAELLGSPKMADLFKSIKQDYDYIVLDTAPIGLISDTYELIKYSDVDLFVIRNMYSRKKIVRSVIQDTKKIADFNLAVVINDIDISAVGYGYNYGYSYGYGYGYGYGYFSDEDHLKNKSLIRRLFKG